MKTETIPFGRLKDWKKERHSKENDLILWLFKSEGYDLKLIKFSSRKQLEKFNIKAKMTPLVFTIVADNCKLHKHEKEVREWNGYCEPGDFVSIITQ